MKWCLFALRFCSEMPGRFLFNHFGAIQQVNPAIGKLDHNYSFYNWVNSLTLRQELVADVHCAIHNPSGRPLHGDAGHLRAIAVLHQ